MPTFWYYIGLGYGTGCAGAKMDRTYSNNALASCALWLLSRSFMRMYIQKKSKIRQCVTTCVLVGLVGLGLMLGFLVDLMCYNIRVLYSTSMVINHDPDLEDRTDG